MFDNSALNEVIKRNRMYMRNVDVKDSMYMFRGSPFKA